jgi:hypothetical protein
MLENVAAKELFKCYVALGVKKKLRRLSTVGVECLRPRPVNSSVSLLMKEAQ